jgi:outer membrane protein insertion porin family
MTRPDRRRDAPARIAHWLLLLAAPACSVLDETWLAKEPIEGMQPREVHAQFEGNGHVASHVLRTAIRPDMLGLSQGLDPDAAAFDATDDIAEYYRSQGFPDAGATFRVEGPIARPGAPDLLVVHFAVNEGQAVVLTSLRLTGNEHHPDRELLPLWSRRQSGTLGLGDPWFVHADLRAFALAIRDYYRRRGWLEVSVDGPDVERRPDAGTATAALTVHEGRQFRFGAVRVADALVRALGDAMPRKPAGEVFTTLRTQQFLLEIRTALLKRGHPNPTVGMAPLPDVTALPEPTMELEVRGDPGPVATYGPIGISGNARTSTGVISRKLDFEEGQPFDGVKEQKAEEKLYRTGLFKRVTFEHGDIADGRMPVEVKVEELDAQSLELLAGYGSYERLRGSVRWEDRNLFGSGRDLALEARVSQRGYRTSATLTDRDLFETEVTGTLGGEAFERQNPSYTDRAVGANTTLRRSLGEHLVTRVGYSYLAHNTTTRVQSVVPPVEDYTDGSVFVELRRDTRDNIVLPNSGTAAFVRSDFTNPAFGGDVSFNRVRTGLSWLVPVTDNTHIGANAEAGWLWPGASSDAVPVSERFFNGGYNSVRSFKQDQLGPKDPDGTPTGGDFRNLFSLELRQQLYGPLEGTLFADAGNIGVKVSDYGLHDMSYALGVGLRLVLPIGPMRVDAGWNPDRNPGDVSWAIHVAIGYPF